MLLCRLDASVPSNEPSGVEACNEANGASYTVSMPVISKTHLHYRAIGVMHICSLAHVLMVYSTCVQLIVCKQQIPLPFKLNSAAEPSVNTGTAYQVLILLFQLTLVGEICSTQQPTPSHRPGTLAFSLAQVSLKLGPDCNIACMQDTRHASTLFCA